MITCTIEADEYIRDGMLGVVRKLRAAGIPARASGDELRLCKVWTADGRQCIGYGKLDWTQFQDTRRTVFRYTPPQPAIGPDVIDIEALVIVDTPLIGASK